MNITYEDLLHLVSGLQPAPSDDDREIEWCDGGAGPVGLARDPKGRIEIFLEGPELSPRFQRVRTAIEHQRWFRAGGDEMQANRILLPSAGHFEQVAAFLSTELVRNGASDDIARAFSTTEPLIDLAIADLMMADEVLLGLCGEMLVLHALVQAVPDDDVAQVLAAWKGHRDTARDFQLGRVGVEVKTTTHSSSSHRFRGIHQLEVGHGVDGQFEDTFALVSIGVEWTPPDEPHATTLPELIELVIERTRSALGGQAEPRIGELLDQVAMYGSPTTIGYDHRTMSSSSRFSQPLRVLFARCYDMGDEAIHLLTTDDLRSRPFIDSDSLFVRVNLPLRLRGDLNPVSGLVSCAAWILDHLA